MNPKIIPKNHYRDSKEKHIDHLDEWRNFSRRSIKNPYVKGYHLKKSNNICEWCNRKFENFTLHHIDYDHLCITNKTIKVPNPTEKRPNGTSKVPDCQSCHQTSPEAFYDCMKRLTAVHKHCNYIISTKTKH